MISKRTRYTTALLTCYRHIRTFATSGRCIWGNVQQSLDTLPLEQIQIPTLIVGSKNDGDIGYENSTNSHAKIPNAELITVEQFGHLIWWGDAQVTKDFQQRIEIFLEQGG